MAASLTSNGLVMPASRSATSNANTLDDYEEGTFTPQSSESSLFSSSSGIYTIIGRFVKTTGKFTVDSNTNGTVFTISLPLGVPSGNEYLGSGIALRTTPTNEYQLRGVSNASRVQLYKGASRTYAEEPNNVFWFGFSWSST